MTLNQPQNAPPDPADETRRPLDAVFRRMSGDPPPAEMPAPTAVDVPSVPEAAAAPVETVKPPRFSLAATLLARAESAVAAPAEAPPAGPRRAPTIGISVETAPQTPEPPPLVVPAVRRAPVPPADTFATPPAAPAPTIEEPTEPVAQPIEPIASTAAAPASDTVIQAPEAEKPGLAESSAAEPAITEPAPPLPVVAPAPPEPRNVPTPAPTAVPRSRGARVASPGRWPVPAWLTAPVLRIAIPDTPLGSGSSGNITPAATIEFDEPAPVETATPAPETISFAAAASPPELVPVETAAPSEPAAVEVALRAPEGAPSDAVAPPPEPPAPVATETSPPEAAVAPTPVIAAISEPAIAAEPAPVVAEISESETVVELTVPPEAPAAPDLPLSPPMPASHEPLSQPLGAAVASPEPEEAIAPPPAAETPPEFVPPPLPPELRADRPLGAPRAEPAGAPAATAPVVEPTAEETAPALVEPEEVPAEIADATQRDRRPTMRNRRLFRRVEFDAALEVNGVAAKLLDLSMGGFAAGNSPEVKPGAVLPVSLKLSIDGVDIGTRMRARMIYGDGARSGGRFVDLTASQTAFLRYLVTWQNQQVGAIGTTTLLDAITRTPPRAAPTDFLPLEPPARKTPWWSRLFGRLLGPRRSD